MAWREEVGNDYRKVFCYQTAEIFCGIDPTRLRAHPTHRDDEPEDSGHPSEEWECGHIDSNNNPCTATFTSHKGLFGPPPEGPQVFLRGVPGRGDQSVPLLS